MGSEVRFFMSQNRQVERRITARFREHELWRSEALRVAIMDREDECGEEDDDEALRLQTMLRRRPQIALASLRVVWGFTVEILVCMLMHGI